MYKLLNILFIILILFFLTNVYIHYFSIINVKIKDFNRKNIDQIINEQISHLPVLNNDTNNVIEFENSLSGEINNDKSRSFWNLLKFK